MTDLRGYNVTEVEDGPQVWTETLYQGETRFGDVVRVRGVPGSGMGMGFGVAWKAKSDEENQADFQERVAAIDVMMADLRDRMPADNLNQILITYNMLYGRWRHQFYSEWRNGL